MCVFKGYKNFTIVSQFESKFVYPGGAEAIPNNYSPVNFDYPDLKRFPEFSKANVLRVTVDEGDCLFLPALWWH